MQSAWRASEKVWKAEPTISLANLRIPRIGMFAKSPKAGGMDPY